MTCPRCLARARFAALTVASPAADWDAAEEALRAAGVEPDQAFRDVTGYGGARDPIDIDALCERLMASLAADAGGRERLIEAIFCGACEYESATCQGQEGHTCGREHPDASLATFAAIRNEVGEDIDAEAWLAEVDGKTDPAPAPSIRHCDIPKAIQDGFRRGAEMAVERARAVLTTSWAAESSTLVEMIAAAVAEELPPSETEAPADLCAGCLAEGERDCICDGGRTVEMACTVGAEESHG